MISVFNGRCRGLGQQPASRVYVQIDVAFRDVLYHLKGARLAVLLAIALHANEDGWAWPSYEVLSRETGYSLDKIRDALAELCRMEINGQRVLLRYQPQGGKGQFTTNRYLLFPTPEEIERFEKSGVSHRPGPGFASQAVVVKHHNGSPLRQNTTTDRCGKTPQQTITILEPEPDNYQEEEEEKEHASEGKEDSIEEIAEALQENGVFPENAIRIAARMAKAGLTAEEALGVYLATLQQVTQQALPDEQAVGRAVYRLEQGIWDAGERAREAIRRARCGQGVDSPDLLTQESEPQESEPPEDAQRIWQMALGMLELELTRATFTTWLAGSRSVGWEGEVLVVEVANGYARDWLETRLRGVVERAVARAAGRPVRVQFVVEER